MPRRAATALWPLAGVTRRRATAPDGVAMLRIEGSGVQIPSAPPSSSRSGGLFDFPALDMGAMWSQVVEFWYGWGFTPWLRPPPAAIAPHTQGGLHPPDRLKPGRQP